MVTPVTQHNACDGEQWYFNNFKCIVRNQRFSTCAVICEQPFTINQWKIFQDIFLSADLWLTLIG